MEKRTLEYVATQLANIGYRQPRSVREGKEAIKRIKISRVEKRRFEKAYKGFCQLGQEGMLSHLMLWITDNYNTIRDEIEKSNACEYLYLIGTYAT